MKTLLSKVLKLAVPAALSLAFGGGAGARTAEGSFGDGHWTWTARSLIVGQTSTATLASGGSPLYTAPMPQYSGVASLLVEYEKGCFNAPAPCFPIASPS